MSETSAEFQLCTKCCGWAFDHGDPGTIHQLCAIVDWDRFVRVAQFHRIQGLVWNSLWLTKAAVPAEAARQLSSDAETIAATNLQSAFEARVLRSEFEQAGVDLLFVKGLTVGALAYPKPLLKMGWDIDLLIDIAQLPDAIDLLRARGYRQITPPAPANLRSWHLSHKESVWNRDQLYIELHTRLADNRHLIPRIDVHSPRREVEVAPGISLPTLDRDELFAYLCVHGASSCWFRLKWITDLAAMLHGAPDIDRLYERSQKLGACRAAGQALLLADRLYGTLAGSSLKDHLLQDRGNRQLLDAAIRQLAGSAEPREPTSYPLGTWRVHFTQLLLKPGLAFKLNEVRRQFADAMA